MEWNNPETAGARPFESSTVMDLNSTEDPALNYFDKFLSVVSSAYHKERATNSSAFVDCILHNAHFFVFFALYLVCRYVNQISVYHLLFCVCLTPLFIYLYINYAPFLLLEEDIKWIRRESRLLNAVSADAYRVMYATRDMNDRVSIKGLDETEVAWVDKAKHLVLKAEDLVATFEKQRKQRDSHTQRICFAMISDNFQLIEELFIQTKQVKQEIQDTIVMKKVQRINICESLERSRCNIISLMDRPIYVGDGQIWLKTKQELRSVANLTSSVVKKIDRLITETSIAGEQIHLIKLQLLLLLPFLKDIQEIAFDSRIEWAWVHELKEIVNEADAAIDKYFLERPAYRIRWLLSIITNWKIKRDIRCIYLGFAELLERKDRYGFKFITRDSSKLAYKSQYHTADEDRDISSVLNRMRNYLNNESDVLGEVFYEVQSLCKQLENMHKLVGDAGIVEGRHNSRIDWLEQTKKIVESAEQSVEPFIKKSGPAWRAGIKLSREIDRINQTINLFVRCIKAYSTESRLPSSEVGLEEDIRAVVSRLTTNNEHASVISIVGIEGIGKSTLARKIYDHGVVMDHFPCRAWVSVSQKKSLKSRSYLPRERSFNRNTFLEDVARQVLRSLKVEEVDNRNEPWIHKVHGILKETKYLLVIDNISTMEELSALEAELPLTSNESRILLTTCNEILALEADRSPHQLRLRTKEESWKLFIQMVHFPPEEKILAKRILDKCGGLPLAIFRLGYLMSGEDLSTAEVLKTVHQRIIHNHIPLLGTFGKESITNSLPPHLFKCLSYFKLFPSDSEIPARRLTALWIAEDLVQVSERKTETLEDVADKYLSELINRDMIQVVARKHNGEVKTCCLPYALQKLNLQDMSLDRLTDHFNSTDQMFGHIHGESSNLPGSYRNLLSILSFDTREGNKPGEEIGNFLQRGIAGGFFHRLHVLDLERVFRPELPNSIGKLSKLKYLGLRWTFLELVPASIGDLLNLQTLDVKHTYVHTLPSSIWKLQKLRHLYLNQSYRSKFMRSKFMQHQQGGSSLKNLQTLWGVFVDKDSPLKDGLEKLMNLRKLGLAFQLDLSEQKALADGIVKLKHLQCLRIRSIGEMGEPRDLLCRPLSDGLENLSSLNLFGMLNPSIVPEFPGNLTDLTLSASFLSEDPMPKLEKLLNLRLLCLYSNSYTGNKMTCSKLKFPQLVVLKLWKLEQLEDWDVQEKAMQNLRELEIRSCTKLNVPRGLKHLKALTELKLTNMPKEFAATIATTKGKIWDDLIDPPAIIAVNWESAE